MATLDPVEPIETLPTDPSPADIRRLADRMLATRRDSIDDLSDAARDALEKALPRLDEQYQRSVERP